MYQRELLIPLGVKTMFWTYDPLVAKNAYLNIVKLGARPTEYIVDMYGSATQSALHGALGTDRFVVAWDLSTENGADRRATAPTAASGNLHSSAPVVNNVVPKGDAGEMAASGLVDAPVVRVEVPTDIEQIIASDFNAAMKLRDATRRAFSHYMGRGYKITAFSHRMPEDRCFYILSRSAA